MTSDDVAALLLAHGLSSDVAGLQALAEQVRHAALDGLQLPRFPMLQQVVMQICNGALADQSAPGAGVDERHAGGPSVEVSAGENAEEAPGDPCRQHTLPSALRPLPPRECWAERGAAEAQMWSMTILTRKPLQHIWLRGQLQADPPYRAPIPVDRKRLCDGSQSGGGPCHYGVTRSVLNGLQLIGHSNFTFNPPNISLYGQVIWVLSGADACTAALTVKRARPAGDVLVVVGPNLHDAEFHACSPAADLIVAPSRWVAARIRARARARLATSQLPPPRVVALPAGVDTAFWRPQVPRGSRSKIVLYDKTAVATQALAASYSHLVGLVEEVLVATGRAVDVIRYGFEHDGYGLCIGV